MDVESNPIPAHFLNGITSQNARGRGIYWLSQHYTLVKSHLPHLTGRLGQRLVFVSCCVWYCPCMRLWTNVRLCLPCAMEECVCVHGACIHVHLCVCVHILRMCVRVICVCMLVCTCMCVCNGCSGGMETDAHLFYRAWQGACVFSHRDLSLTDLSAAVTLPVPWGWQISPLRAYFTASIKAVDEPAPNCRKNGLLSTSRPVVSTSR